MREHILLSISATYLIAITSLDKSLPSNLIITPFFIKKIVGCESERNVVSLRVIRSP